MIDDADNPSVDGEASDDPDAGGLDDLDDSLTDDPTVTDDAADADLSEDDGDVAGGR